MTKEIQLSKGYVALVDDEDYDYINQWKWCLSGSGYAIRHSPMVNGCSRHAIYMHRVITGVDGEMVADHINRVRTDNRRENLRICTKKQNQSNRCKSKRNTSGYKGVRWDKKRSKWTAHIGVEGKNIFLGRHEDISSAIRAYNDAALKYNGEYALLNVVEHE